MDKDIGMIKGYCGSLYGAYRQISFSNVYESVEDFLADYNNVGIPAKILEINARTLYYLLYANYGNSTIASSDINRFKYKLFGLIFQFGPTWERRLSIQEELRTLTADELMMGSRQIYNTAQNPSTAPGTDTDEELPYINAQNVSKNRKGKLEAYALLDSLLKNDVTGAFLEKFRKLFLTVVEPEAPLLYYTDGGDDDE